jgi:D-alanyl-D-alanine carboxypeptidase/D-alanyl-D-alanine-endopeptidase (penicillin-binding protein 4)
MKIIVNIIIALMALTPAFAQELETFNETYRESVSEAKSMPRISPEDSANSIASLGEEIDLILAQKRVKGAKVGIAVYSVDNQKFIYEKNIDQPLTPASCTKLMTTFTALETLGHDFKIRTSVYCDTDAIVDSVLYGNLFLVGRGDPFLSSNDIDSLARQIKSWGIKEIKGQIYADGTYFDDKSIRKEYSGDKDHVEKLPPITAFCLEGNVATVIVSGQPGPGESALVKTNPPSDGFKIYNSCKVRGKKSAKSKRRSSLYFDGKEFFESSREIDIDQEPIFPVYLNVGDAPPRRRKKSSSSFSVVSRLQKDGFQAITVKGNVNKSDIRTKRYHILNSELIAAGALKNRLAHHGIPSDSIFGVCDIDTMNANNLMAEISRPISELVAVTNRESDNFVAEYLFKIIGAEHKGNSDNAKKTREVQKKLFKEINIHCEKCKLNDGSGLSRKNLLTARSLIEILDYTRSQPYYALLDSSLARAGKSGTLKKRMNNTIAEDNLHAKTGTLRNASALSGYVTTLDNENLIFAILFNGEYVYDYKQAENSIGLLLASFFYFNLEK